MTDVNNVLVFRRRATPPIEPQTHRGPDLLADLEQLRLDLANAGFVSGGLLEPPPAAAAPPKQLVADGARWAWAPVHVPAHQLPGFRPFHGVTWMPSPAEQAEAARRRRRASRDWSKEIFARG